MNCKLKTVNEFRSIKEKWMNEIYIYIPDEHGKQIGRLAEPKILCLALFQVHPMHQVQMQRASCISVPIVQMRA